MCVFNGMVCIAHLPELFFGETMKIIVNLSAMEIEDIKNYVTISSESLEDTILRIIRAEIMHKKMVSDLKRPPNDG